MATIKFYVGLSTSLPLPANRDSNALYFCTDTGQIYKGSTIFTEPFKVVAALPSNPAQGVLYVSTTDNIIKTWTGSVWRTVALPAVTTISNTAAQNTDNTTPTTKAVYEFVTNKIADVVGGDGTFVTDVTYSAGQLTISKGDDTSSTNLNGVVYNPTYDATTRKITLPYRDSSGNATSLNIELGKDAVVTSGTYNTTTHNIELTLSSKTDGTNFDKVLIPVADLIDIYTASDTDSVDVTVSDDNEISADVKISSETNNAISIVSTDGKKGLYVEDLSGEVDANTTAIAGIQNETTGILAQAKSYTDTQITWQTF